MGLSGPKSRRASRRGRAASPRFWCVLTAALLVLGLNKQLDMQTLLNDIGRRMAMTEGWYGRRRIYQALFIGVVATAGLTAVGGVSWLAHRQWKKNILALVGTVFLYVFVLIRASSFHHVDAMLGWRFLGWKWNWVLELGGIVVVALGGAPSLEPWQEELRGDAICSRFPWCALIYFQTWGDRAARRREPCAAAIVVADPGRLQRTMLAATKGGWPARSTFVLTSSSQQSGVGPRDPACTGIRV